MQDSPSSGSQSEKFWVNELLGGTMDFVQDDCVMNGN